MKSFRILHHYRSSWWLALLGLGAGVASSMAADTNSTPASVPELTPQQMFEGGTNVFNNWIDLSAGGFLTHGNKAQAQQQHQNSAGAFGGIEDLHVQGEVSKGTTFTLDGHSIFDNHDYDLGLGLSKEKLGYLRFSISEFRTWYNGDGGFYAPTGSYYRGADEALGLNRGEISFEGGLTLEKMPQVKFKYTHNFRDGDKSSTSWGLTHPDTDVTRSISPSFHDISEHSDTFQLDVTHHVKATEFGAGFSYQTGKLEDSLKIDQFPGEPVEQKITDRQQTSYDLFNAHAFTETWIKKDLFLSTGLSYSDLDNTFSGSRIYGSDFDVNYVPAAQNGFGYYGLTGGSRLDEYVMDVNLMARPVGHLTIVPSIRVQKEDTDASFTGTETLSDNTTTPFNGNSNRGMLDVRERLDVTYNGFTNWVLYARGEVTEGNGNLTENGGLVQINGIGVPPIQRETDDSRFFQKYSIGARWYPLRKLTIDVGGYYKLNDYNYDNNIDSTPNTSANRYPAYLLVQNFETYDGNVRLTLRPAQTVTLVTRYEYQISSIHTRPDPITGLQEAESSKMTSHILAQDVSWAPWTRLYFQAGFNYVLSDTRTPTSDYTQAILKAQNNYWTLNFTTGFVIDNKTDLNVGYFYYLADNYQDNSSSGLPLGSGAEEHGVNATLTRRLTKHLRVSLRYGYYHYDDETFGGHQDFYGHLVYTSLRYRF
ncbi:MAG TPA: hypothetical protein VKY92_06890 [Verrucomicrobiae bacterium]|nr:hypothetical protein [Verrucomicrobiae bacterium]